MVVIGKDAAYNYTGGDGKFCAIGYQAAYNLTTGSYNTVLGYQAMYAGTTAGYNVVVGWYAGVSMTEGVQNTIVGYRAGDSLTDADNNTLIGKDAGEQITTGDNNLCLGYNSNPSSATVDNEAVIGNSGTATLRCATQTISSYSDRRDKTDIVGIPIGLDFVNKLRPVKFKWDIRNVEEGNPHQGTVRAGFIAQELQEVQEGNEFMDLVYANNPDKLEAKYSSLIPVLTKAIQDLSAKVEELESKLNN